VNAPAAPAPLRPRDAATLILVDRSSGRAHVLLGKRHAGHAFMPNKYVFPGGALDAADRRMSVAAPLDPLVEAKLMAATRQPSPGLTRALALAAIRETFEETGLAVGVVAGGGARRAPAGAWRRFAETGVLPALDRLDLVARAITPPGRSRRYDARFFVADASSIAFRVEGVVHGDAELVELIWTPLDEALRLDLPQITRAVLGDLAAATQAGMDRARPRPFYRQRRGRGWRGEL
jgi:8-oxo-dGTP pyrophosphatase MutT (NUDIX family)